MPSSNDNFANRQAVGAGFSWSIAADDTIQLPDEQNVSAGFYNRSVWYTYVIPATDNYEFIFTSNFGSNVRGFIYADAASLAALGPSLYFATQSNNGWLSLTVGQTIIIQMPANTNVGAVSSTFSINRQNPPVPTNDDIQNAIRIYNPSGIDIEAIEAATLQPSEPPHSGKTKSVWYVYIANRFGTLSFSATGTNVAAFRYRTDTYPTAVNFSQISAFASTTVTPGEIYYFQVMQ